MNRIEEIIIESINTKKSILENSEFKEKIARVVNMITESLRKGGKIHFCGNGGSAADAQHIASELSGRFYSDRKPFNAEALHCNTSYLTAVSNDYGFEFVYSRMLQASAKKGDLLVGLSTSGNSNNVVNAFETAKKMGVSTVAFTGANGGKLGKMADIVLNVPSDDTPRIQECHILIGHIVCELVENNLIND